MRISNPVLSPKLPVSYNCFFNFILQLNKISCVSFGLYAVKLIENPNQHAKNCINLVEKWLKKPNSITQVELNDAAEVAPTVFADTINIARVAGYEFYAAKVVYNAYCTISVSRNFISFTTKLFDYLKYLLPKEPEYNNFNIDLLKQNQQAYKFLEKVSKLEDWQVTEEDLFGIRQIFDVLEEVGAPLDPNEFIWDGEVTEKHKLLQSIRREF